MKLTLAKVFLIAVLVTSVTGYITGSKQKNKEKKDQQRIEAEAARAEKKAKDELEKEKLALYLDNFFSKNKKQFSDYRFEIIDYGASTSISITYFGKKSPEFLTASGSECIRGVLDAKFDKKLNIGFVNCFLRYQTKGVTGKDIYYEMKNFIKYSPFTDTIEWIK